MKKSSLFLLLFSLFAAAAQGNPGFQEKILNEVWDAVARNHFRKDFDAVYRQKVYMKHLPAIRKAADIPELTVKLNNMLDDIGDSHLRVFAPTDGKTEQTIRPVENPGPADPPADPGFTVLTCGKELQVRTVRPGSAAADAGIRPGDILLAVEGWTIRHREGSAIPASMKAAALLERGGVGSICEVILKKAAGQEKKFRLRRSANGGKMFQSAALPPLLLRYESRMLTQDTGYLYFNIFAPDVVRQFRKDRRNGIFKNARNLIIDLRGNPGGILLTAEWLGAWCFPKKISLGTLLVDGVKLAPVTEPQKGAFSGKVAVLTDGDSASTSELFAAAVQDNKAGLVIGSRTPGKCLPSMFWNLPSGFTLQTVSGDARRPSGKSIEKVGVTPDIFIENNFPDSRDQVIAKALSCLEKKEN